LELNLVCSGTARILRVASCVATPPLCHLNYPMLTLINVYKYHTHIVTILDGQVRSVRLQPDNFCLFFLRQPTDKRQTAGGLMLVSSRVCSDSLEPNLTVCRPSQCYYKGDVPDIVSSPLAPTLGQPRPEDPAPPTQQHKLLKMQQLTQNLKVVNTRITITAKRTKRFFLLDRRHRLPQCNLLLKY
jgi:hypothetical protein